jgi:YVTN family beta-propeller protein
LLARHQELVREAFTTHRGREIDTQGDAFFVAFHSAADAVSAAVAIQWALAAEVWAEDSQVRVRIGIHTGEAAAAGERYVGFSVHRAARVGAVAYGGQVLLSSTTRDLVADDLPAGVTLRDLGVHRLKDVERPERISQVVAPGLQPVFPALRTGTPRRQVPLSLVAVALVLIGGAVAASLIFTRGGTSTANASTPIEADSVGVFEAKQGGLVTQTPVGTSPQSIAADNTAVWVSNADSASLSRLNARTGQTEQTIDVGSGPAGVALGGGLVWVANSLDGTVSQVDPGINHSVRTINVGSQPGGITYGLGGVWVANTSDRTVMRIDPDSGKTRQVIPVGAGVDAIAVGEGSLWVASEIGGTVARIDPRAQTTQTINVGRGPDAVAVGGGSVWVANNLDGTVSRLDPATNGVAATIRVGAGPVAIAVSADGKSVWVSSELSGTLAKIDPRRNAVAKTIQTRNRPEGVALSGDRMYVAVRTGGGAHRGGTLRVDVPEISGMDLDPANAYINWQLLRVTNDGLVGYRRAGGGEGAALVPDLATSLPTPSNSGLTYTFQVRPRIHYSTGQLVRPADFRRAIERALTAPGGAGFYFSGVVGAGKCRKTHCDLSRGITTGANTVTFHLARPDPDFLFKLALPTADAVPAAIPLKAQLSVPATGPYMVAHYDPKHHVVRLVRNPRFTQWSAAAQPDGYPHTIVERFGMSSQAAARAVQHGTADLTNIGTQTSRSLLATLRVRSRGQLHSNPLLLTAYVALNTRVAPFNDLRVRRAFNYAVDRNRLVDLQGGSDLASPTCQFLPRNVIGYRPYCPYMAGHKVAAPYTGPDMAKARLLVAASHTRGQTIVLHDFKHSGSYKTDPYLLGVLRRLGYRVRLSVVSVKAFFARAGNSHQRWQLAPGGWLADYPGASTFFVPLLTCAAFKPGDSTNQNFSEFCDPPIDREISRALALGPERPRAAAALWAKVDREIVDKAPFVATVGSRNVDLVSRRVGNYIFSAGEAAALLDQLWVR